MLLTHQRSIDQAWPARAESVGLARRAVAQFATQQGATEDELQHIRLAVSEAASNAVRHAYRGGQGAFRITATAVADELWVLVADEGCGHQRPPSDPGLGWGLALIAHACDKFTLAERSHGGTEARMRFLIGSTG